jgi:hypothetical protein
MLDLVERWWKMDLLVVLRRMEEREGNSEWEEDGGYILVARAWSW